MGLGAEGGLYIAVSLAVFIVVALSAKWLHHHFCPRFCCPQKLISDHPVPTGHLQDPEALSVMGRNSRPRTFNLGLSTIFETVPNSIITRGVESSQVQPQYSLYSLTTEHEDEHYEAEGADSGRRLSAVSTSSNEDTTMLYTIYTFPQLATNGSDAFNGGLEHPTGIASATPSYTNNSINNDSNNIPSNNRNNTRSNHSNTNINGRISGKDDLPPAYDVLFPISEGEEDTVNTEISYTNDSLPGVHLKTPHNNV